MSIAVEELEEKLKAVTERLDRLEASLSSAGDFPPRWRYLVPRAHAWRRQLAIKGRNMTVGQLISTLFANRLTPEQASDDLDLPLEAITEALAYYGENKELIQLEAAEERRWLAARGLALEPQSLPR